MHACLFALLRHGMAFLPGAILSTPERGGGGGKLQTASAVVWECLSRQCCCHCLELAGFEDPEQGSLHHAWRLEREEGVLSWCAKHS